MKVATGDVGLGMLRGEYFGVKELHRFVPEGIPHPVAWGTYRADPNTHFYLCDFIDMIEELPDIRRFCSMLAKLHHNSMVSDDAPTEFGFPTVTYEGNLYQDVTWCKTWEDSFKRLLQAFVDQEKISHGPSEELDELLPPFMEKVIPRLLRPLQTHGRNVKPALIHGDIWYGNMGTNADTGEPIMINPSVFWGHNECTSMLKYSD
jgi:protein-ribulosamine 3-kinase